jgi:beta-lactamase superfamily II metal-dependent hydrolase
MIVVSHPHTDHIEGFIQVLQRYDVKKVLLPNVDFNSPQYAEFLRLMKEENAEVVYAQQGQRWTLDEGTVLDILYPTSTETAHPKQSDDVNDSSIVAQLIFGRSKFLLTGDSGTEIEKTVEDRFNLDSDLLKVGHHGSKHSTSQEFLDEVTPEFAVIQVGKNNYGHPAPEILDRLTKSGAQIFRTDQNGTIEFKSDGFHVWLIK